MLIILYEQVNKYYSDNDYSHDQLKRPSIDCQIWKLKTQIVYMRVF